MEMTIEQMDETPKLNLVPAEYHRKAFTSKHHTAGVNGGRVKTLCGLEWTQQEDCPEAKAKPECQRCYASWKKRTNYGEHHPAFGIPRAGNAFIHEIKVRPVHAC